VPAAPIEEGSEVTSMARADGNNPDLRASDAERDAVASELGQHFQDGRLEHAELDERLGAAMAAKTRRDLVALLEDLPRGAADQPSGGITEPEQAGAPGARPWHSAQPAGTRGHPALVVLLPLLVAVAVLGGQFGGWQHAWPFAPFGFLWLIIPILAVRTWVRRVRRRQWR
jgi:hypothetical protein